MRAHFVLVTLALAACPGCGGDTAHAPVTDTSGAGTSTTGTLPTDTSTSTSDVSTTIDTPTTDIPTTGDSSTSTSTTGTSTTDALTTGTSTTEPEVFDYEGEHVVVITDSEIDLCGGTMAHMDRYIERISTHLGVDPPVGSDRIRFTWVQSQEEATQLCNLGTDVAGCAKNNRIYSMFAPHNHELAHSVSYGLGLPPPFFREGLAVAFGGYMGRAWPTYLFNPIDMDIVELLTLSSSMLGDAPDGYERAGRFAAYLIENYGLQSYLQLYKELPKAAGMPEIDQAFQGIFGVTLDESISGFVPPWGSGQFDRLLSECNAPDIGWDGDLLEMEEWVYCTPDNAIGPYDGDLVAIQYTLNVEVGGMYELRLVGDEQEATIVPDFDFTPFIGVSILPCGFGEAGIVETRRYGTPRLGGLSPGRHSLRLIGRRTLPWLVAFTLKRILPDPEDVFKDAP